MRIQESSLAESGYLLLDVAEVCSMWLGRRVTVNSE